MELRAAFEEYLLSCRADGLAETTVRWYSSLLSAFVRDVPVGELAAVTTTMIREYVVGLRSRDVRYVNAPQKPVQPGGLSEASVRGHITALHAFWSWCSREYGIRNPMGNVRRPKREVLKPKAIAAGDFVKLFHATRDDLAGRRDRAILCFLADTGCRLGGLLGLKLGELSLEDRRAVVCEKGDRTRQVVFTRFTVYVLLEWLDVRPSLASDYVFLSLQTGQALTASGLSQMMGRLKARAGVEGRVNPHSFRHNFAREYLRNGGDLATLGQLMGHSNLNTTAMYYAVFDVDELADLHEQYSPLQSMLAGQETD